MRLKSLDLLGFKSFLEPTTIGFAAGLTAVVGPNGCGKSNVVDAVRWVLGEQAPTRLRGKNTEDLIYAGNDQNPAAGLAEVSLILEAEEGSCLPEPYAALSEVAVTRRVYRSGDSEYLLNKIPCRLKDITEFFMAAQIHSRGYSLIEQGKIEEIIQAKPHELRSMIEEAAGLSLFKGRREMSERKLERVRENLARLNDVLSEIERQLNYARRQAKKAEQYKIIRAELSDLERLTAARRLIAEREMLALEDARSAELASSIEVARARSLEVRSIVDASAAAEQAARGDLSAAERELENLHAGAAERERTREFLTRRLIAIDEAEPATIARIADLEHRATLARATRAEAGARLARENASNQGGGEAQLTEMTARLREAERGLRNSERAAESLKDDLSEIVREAAVIRGRLGDLTGERAELEQRTAAAVGRTPILEAQIAEARERMAEAERRLDSLHAEFAESEAGEREAREREIEARATLDQLSQRIANLRSALAAAAEAERSDRASATSRRLSTVLESMNGDGPPAPPAWLRDVLRPPSELAPALHAVLGDDMESVVVDSPAFALQAIEILKRDSAGRLSFVQEPDAPVAAHGAIQAQGISGRLVDMIAVEPRFRNLAETLLGHVLVADNLDSAMAASNLNGRGTVFVTRDGDVLDPGRMIAGGSAAEPGVVRSADLVTRESAARELAQAEEDHRKVARRLDAYRAEVAQADFALDGLRNNVHECERVVDERRKTIAQAEQTAALAEAESAGARRRLSEIVEAVTSSNLRLEEVAIAEQDARARLAVLRDQVAHDRTAIESMAASAAEAAARVEARKAELAAMELELRHAVETAAQIETQIDEHRRSLDRSRIERADFEREVGILAAQREAARVRESELSEVLDRLRSECAGCVADLEAKRAELDQAQAHLQAVEAEAMECNLKRERARTLSEELARSFQEKFEAAFDQIAAEIVPALEGRDPVQDEERVRDLRARAERIGEVNLAAESEVKELEERAQVLSVERADLDSALQDLTKTITHLNREARKRFAETFEGAARNFEELFPKLMRGGKGRLELTDTTDVLEAGVNIMIQPAGKKVKEIGLLSGGEKALSAMALVFSLFLLNPSPFCVMDEVDAPLDEFSLARFTDLLGELKSRSQFIVITHNQRTMQRADQIHGVTMDRPGISKIISLKIPEAA